ncbi:MAG: exodeoxyribonuclease VII small subunit [Chlorobiaceae bacterium]|nr:exodeoxyribonuclease VII small subunit [Chlorobiaceae bacterium]MBA4309561.1 exodeoxyribonuclease VII small subunit [Chlorobiaceae bacterium]
MKKKQSPETRTFQENLERLEEISRLLEEENDLEISIQLYEEGVELTKLCYEKLKNAELKITELKSNVNLVSPSEK